MKITHVADIDRKKIVLNGCTITYSGVVFDLMNPNPKLIHLVDIAHGLAYNSRWNGATKRIYTIAEHCIRVSSQMGESKDERLSGLFHDAEEAYWGDMIKPLKEIIKINSPEVIQKMEDLRMMIFKKFKIKYCDTKKEDWDELVWDFENMIITNNHKPLTPKRAEWNWLFLADKYISL